MSDNSRIGWTEATWQLTAGCLMKSPGCANCYAQTMANRLRGMARADQAAGRDPKGKAPYLHVLTDEGRWNGRVTPLPANLHIPLGWKRGRMIFVDSMSDLFFGDEDDRKRCEALGVPFEPVPLSFIAQAFAVMQSAPQHTFQVLTKRPGRMASITNDRGFWYEVKGWLKGNLRTRVIGSEVDDRRMIIPNLWLGTSCEDQERAELRVPELRNCPAAVRFLSLEPLLGPIDLTLDGLVCCDCPTCSDGSCIEPATNANGCRRCEGTGSGDEWDIDWVIAGCESNGHGLGRGAEHYPEWAGSLIDQCAAAGVAFFNKQMPANGRVSHDPAFWPERFRVQQMPVAANAAGK